VERQLDQSAQAEKEIITRFYFDFSISSNTKSRSAFLPLGISIFLT
jgi:hypothetical protein